MGSAWSGPSKALQFHVDLHAQVDRAITWARQTHGHEVRADQLPPIVRQRALITSAMQNGAGLDGTYTQENINQTMYALRVEYDTLNRGETHYVSHNVAQSVSAAAKVATPEALLPTDLPCPHGLIVFETPLFIRDPAPPYGPQAVRAMGWRVAPVAQRQPDGSEVELTGIQYFIYDSMDSREAYLDFLGRDPYHDLIPGIEKLAGWVTDISGWTFGTPWFDAGDEPGFLVPGAVSTSVAEFRLWVQSYFAWTWQKIIVSEPYQPNRAERRRLERGHDEALLDGYIKVMKLRRVDRPNRPSEDDGENRMYDHSWMVRGHWRNQHCPSLGPARIDGDVNEASHRLVWISPYIKGDGPLVVGHAVSSAVR